MELRIDHYNKARRDAHCIRRSLDDYSSQHDKDWIMDVGSGFGDKAVCIDD